ncbi:MAG: hypothetical protein ABI832_06935 [bacterium]
MTLSRPGTPTHPQTAPSWQDILDPGETLLWQGRPGAGLAFGLSHGLRLLRSAIMLGLFLYLLARLETSIATYLDVRLIVLFVFFLPVPLDLVKSMITRSLQSYALTPSRAIIVTWMGPFGRKVQSCPLAPGVPLTLLQGRRGSILFTPTPRWFTGLITAAPVVGFERISDAPAVYTLMLQAQRNAG